MLLTEKIRRCIFTLGLSTTLILGHLVFTYLLYELDYPALDYYGYVILVLFLTNVFCFFAAIALQFTRLPEKHKIMHAAIGLLLNVPFSMAYLIIVIYYEI